MATPYGLSIGNLSNALRLTGGDPDLAERLLAEEQTQRRAPPIAPINDLPAISRGLPENPYTEPAPNPFKRNGELPDDGAMRDFEPERVVARPKEQRSVYDSPEIQAALEKVGMAPKTYGGSAPNGQVPGNPYAEDPMPVQTGRAQFASLGSQDEAQRVAMRAPGSAPVEDPRRVAPPPQQPGAVPPTPQQQALQRVAPPPMQLPQGTQQALQATGSQYQVPEVQPIDPRAGVRQLQGSIVGSANDRAGLTQQHAAIQSGVDAGQSQVASNAADVSEQRNAAVDERGEAMLGRTDANRKDAYDHVEQMRQAVADKPGEQRPGLRIAGQILSFIPGLSGIGRGMYRMAKGKDAEAQAEWASKIAGHETIRAADTAMNDSEHGDFKNEQVENHMARLERDAVALNRAEAIAKAGSSDQARLEGANKALQIRDQMASTLMGWKAQEQKAAGAGSRNAEDANILNALSSVPDTERPDLAMKMGPRALELLSKSQKNTTNVVDMGKDLADTDKTRADLAKEGTGHEVVPGYVDTIGLDPPTRAELRKNAVSTASVIEDLGKLRKLRERNKGGTWNQNDQQEASTVMGAMSTKLSQMNGAGAPSESERELFMKSLTDPTGFYMFKDPTELYDRMAQSFRSNLESKMKAVGVVRQGAANAGGVRFTADPTPDDQGGGISAR